MSAGFTCWRHAANHLFCAADFYRKYQHSNWSAYISFYQEILCKSNPFKNVPKTAWTWYNLNILGGALLVRFWSNFRPGTFPAPGGRWKRMEKRRGGLRSRNDLPVFIEEDHHEVGTICITYVESCCSVCDFVQWQGGTYLCVLCTLHIQKLLHSAQAAFIILKGKLLFDNG